ncbi:hypothetical protein N5923_15335 [Erwiniaceae bacterium BAC15a-03b]|uniref:Uncharacterized protein n=1 Tax=Winslowiella arboricola TaxID=2978220 RepID=A0A9J6PTJ0_9GAMM|nr:terpene synthase family protein [Winslowiella arboricola]MCU5774317.1 hypothetical protein [Winslowiella arboricola]MCU5778864.1 hypothetical protein [Winslowiella arboricola]
MSTLSAERYNAIISDLGHNGLWNTEVMELAPFIALNLPGWEQVALRIEDEESHCVLFLPAMRDEANILIVIRQAQNQHGQLFYQPLVGQRFEEISSGKYGDHFLAAIYAANFNLLPGQLGSHEVGGFRQQLQYTLEHNQNCRDFIEQRFFHWAPAAPVTTPPYRGNNDEFEHHLSTLGFTIIARGEDVYRQVPQIHEAQVLFNSSLHYTLNHSAKNTSRLAGLLARRLGIRPDQVTSEMLEMTRARLLNYYRVTLRYLEEDGGQILLSEQNKKREGIGGQAFPGDSQHRIVFTTINNGSSFLEKLHVVSHENSHMLPGEESTDDLWYDISYGLPDELRRTTAGIAAMVAEEEESASLQGFTELILAKIFDDLMMKSRTPAGMRRPQFLEMLERIRSAVLDDQRWQQFLRYAPHHYPLSPEELNTLREEIYHNRIWRVLARLTGLNPTSPAGLLADVHANKMMLLKVILQNADSLVTLVFGYDEQLARQLDRQGHRFIQRDMSSDSFDTLSDTSLTTEPNYTALAHPETLTPYQLHSALEDLAHASTTLADTRHPEGADMLAVSRFLTRTAARIAARLGYLTGQQSALPQISTTLFLTTMRKMLSEKLMTPQQILNVILPGRSYQGWSICEAVASNFWCAGKLLAWQQLVNDCFNLLHWPIRHSYQDEFISSPNGRELLKTLANQLREIAPYSEHYPEVINTLSMLIKDGLIPFSYQLAFDIRNLMPRGVETASPVAVMDIFSTLNYVREFRHIINDEQIQRLGLAEMLAGVATQHRWFVVGEDEEGEMQYFFDPLGNDISAQPPQLENNELVLVLRGNTLHLYQQLPEGPRDIGSSLWQPGNNHALIAAVQQLTVNPSTNQQLINQQFLRRISLTNAEQPATEAVAPAAAMPATGWLADLSNTSQVHKNAVKIHRQLDKYHWRITADTRFTQRGEEGALSRIKRSLTEFAARLVSDAERAEVNAISGCISEIEAKLQQISVSEGIDLRLRHFNTLPADFHQMRKHTLNLSRSYSQSQRHKNSTRAEQRDVKKISRNSEAGISQTLKTKGKIHSMVSERRDGTFSGYHAGRLREYFASEPAIMAENSGSLLPPAVAAESFADIVNLVFNGPLGIMSRTPFSSDYQQQCLERDQQINQQKEIDRAKRDVRSEELIRQIRHGLINVSFELQQWLAESKARAGRREHLTWLTDDADITDSGHNQPASDGAGNAAGSEVAVEQPLAEQQAPQFVSVAPVPISEAVAVAASGGMMVNRGGGGTVTQLLSPGTVPQLPQQGSQWTHPVRAWQSTYAPHSGTNIRTMSELQSRDNVLYQALVPQRTEATLRISHRPPARVATHLPARSLNNSSPVTPGAQQIRDLRLLFFGRGNLSAAPARETDGNAQARIAETAREQPRPGGRLPRG